jgi:hypothetical protein
MAINRTNVGRQMVGDLGNFVGRDLGKQFMSKPQKLAEGDTVAEEIAFETVSFTDDITGKTKTFKYNPETHHPPDSSGRMRKKGVNVSDVALQGGTTFFDTAELVEQPAAPAAAAAPRQERPPIPINPETDADEAARQNERRQLFNPLDPSKPFSQQKSFDKFLMEQRVARKIDPLMSGRTFGLMSNDPNRTAKEMLVGQPHHMIRDVSSENRGEDAFRRGTSMIPDPAKRGFGFTEEEADEIIARHADPKTGILSAAGLKEAYREGLMKEGAANRHSVAPDIRRNEIEVVRDKPNFLDPFIKKMVKEEGDDADEGELEKARKANLAADRMPSGDTSGGLSSLDRPSREVEQADKVTRLDGPEAGVTSALRGLAPAPPLKPLAEELTARITPVKTENLPSITPRARLQIDADKEAAQREKEEEEEAAIKKAQSKLDPKQIKALKALEKSANLLSIAKKKFESGDGSVTKKEERDYQTSKDLLFPSMSEKSPEAYETEYSVSKYMPTRDQLNEYEAFFAPDDRIDWSEDADSPVDTGSPFRQGGLVQLAKGGLEDLERGRVKAEAETDERAKLIDQHKKDYFFFKRKHPKSDYYDTKSTETLREHAERFKELHSILEEKKKAYLERREQDRKDSLIPGDTEKGINERSKTPTHGKWNAIIDQNVKSGGPVRYANGGGLSSMQPPIDSGDFVIASDVVSGIGDGSSDFGVQRLTEELGVHPRPFSAALGGEVRGPGSGLDDLIQTSVRGKQAARLANQEFVVPRQDVMKIGKGSLKNGQEMLYALMDRVRKQKSGGQQPPRLQGSLAALMGNMRS